jgi:hypothetical protein
MTGPLRLFVMRAFCAVRLLWAFKFQYSQPGKAFVGAPRSGPSGWAAEDAAGQATVALGSPGRDGEQNTKSPALRIADPRKPLPRPGEGPANAQAGAPIGGDALWTEGASSGDRTGRGASPGWDAGGRLGCGSVQLRAGAMRAGGAGEALAAFSLKKRCCSKWWFSDCARIAISAGGEQDLEGRFRLKNTNNNCERAAIRVGVTRVCAAIVPSTDGVTCMAESQKIASPFFHISSLGNCVNSSVYKESSSYSDRPCN